MTAKTVLITGCSSGIGRALADEFRNRGLTVFATARRDESLQELQDAGFQALKLDISDPQSIHAAVEAVVQKSGKIDFLVNNAGHSLFGPMAEISLDEVRQVMEINFTSQLALCQAVIPTMAEQGAGCIVNVGSIVGYVTTPFVGAYSASKSALHIMSEALRMEVAPLGIDVVVVQPGAVKSQVADNGLQHSNLQQYETETSLYYPVRSEIRKRASASQDNPTSANEFAVELVEQLLKTKRSGVIRIGKGVGFLSMLAKLPVAVRDKIFTKHFNLDVLSKK